MRSAIVCAVLCLMPGAMLFAQPDAAHGELRGLITDPANAIVAGAVVSVRNVATGLSREALSMIDGYRLLLLPPGSYDMQVQQDGFRTQLLKSVSVTVGQVAVVDVRLELGVRNEVVEVNDAPAVVDIERTQQANTLEQGAIQNLPIDRRDYLTFTLLAPGVVDATALADNSDFRAVQTPTSGLSFYGSNGRGNSVTVDGGEANNDSGGVRPTLSQEAVQEFQVNRSNYSAQFGMASGGVINIVSKSGTNALRGSVFGFFRDDVFDAVDPFANVFQNGKLERVKPPSERQQFGAAAGLPLVRDRTFLFASFEGLRRDESSVVSVLTDPSVFQPTPEQASILSALPAPLAAQLGSALTSSPSTGDLFANNSGVFPFTTREWKLSGRLDHRFVNADQLFFRYSYNNSDETNANVRALVGATRGNNIASFDSTASIGWMQVLNGHTLNEARVQWSYRNFLVSSLERFGPELNVLGFGFFNRDYSLPSNSISRRYEFKDNFSYSQGAHNVKAGAQVLLRGLHTESHTFFAGRFTFGPLPGSLLHPALASTTINGLQAFNLGLAQTYQQGFGDPTIAAMLPYYGMYAQDSWKLRRNLTLDFGLRYELDFRLHPMPLDKNNLSPRFGFAWDLLSDQTTIVRGGYGIYYSPIYFHIDYVVNALGTRDGRRPIAQVFSSIQTPGPSSANNVFNTLRRQGVIGVPTPTRSVTPADLEQFGINPTQTGPVPPLSVLFENSGDYVNQYSQQASLEIERAITPNVSVSASYIGVRTLKIPRARDKNLLPAPVDPRLGIRVWSTPYFVDPLIAQFNVYESTANASYNALILELKKRFSRSFSVNANYTLSKAIDDVVDYGSDFQAFDQTNIQAERALSSFDQRHKLVVFAHWMAPGGLEIAPIFRSNSPRPFNLLAGADLNQDRHSTTDRPIFAGRNTGIGASFWTFDLRIAKRLALGESRNLEFIADGFNIFNRLNFASLNNTVGNIPGPFNLQGRRERSPSEPLGFTSAFDPRRLQLGVRLRF
ncbi:MAG: TonB-dependent receptor [Bryobacteraceae bacterium]